MPLCVPLRLLDVFTLYSIIRYLYSSSRPQQASTQPEETIPCSQQNGSHQTTPHSSSPDLPNGSKAKPANGGKGAKKQAQQQHQPSGKENSRGQERKAVEKALIEMVDSEELGERKMSMSSTESDLVSLSLDLKSLVKPFAYRNSF